MTAGWYCRKGSPSLPGTRMYQGTPQTGPKGTNPGHAGGLTLNNGR
jgi:hypothetical protein